VPASVSAYGAEHARRLVLLLQRIHPPALADRLAVDRVLEPFEERFKVVDPLLQGLDTPLMILSGFRGGSLERPPSATQLNDTVEKPCSARRGPASIAGTAHVPSLL
jgi:hypothetical protein